MSPKAFIKLRKKLLAKRIVTPDGCWIYQGCTRQGYGEIHSEGRTLRAHRVSMMVFRNHPELLTDRDTFVCHKCDNKLCINPEHLYLGTWIENNMDAALRDPTVNRAFALKAAKQFAEKHGIRYWKSIKNIEKYYKK